jgi:hypothetical protein
MIENTMNCIDLDKKTVNEAKELAAIDAEFFISNVKMSKHRSVANQTGISYLNFNDNYNMLSFTVHENPFSIYIEKLDESELEKVRTVDYSFPHTCVTDSVRAYMEEYINVLNDKFRFDLMEGDITYKDKKTKEVNKYNGFRHYFNFPENSKSINPSMIGHLRIETIKNKLTNNSTYQLIITKNNQHIENISSLKEVASIIKKYSTYKVYIKPCKIISSFLYYEEKYKLMWQVCCMREIEVKIDEMDFLRKLVLSENDDNNENDDTKTENDN